MRNDGIILKILNGVFSVCKIKSVREVNFDEEFVFVGKTDEELSLVCRTQSVPPSCTAREDGWNAFRAEGTLDFSLVGILSDITRALAEQGISVFVVSTFQTDYVLVKAQALEQAVKALTQNGYRFV